MATHETFIGLESFDSPERSSRLALVNWAESHTSGSLTLLADDPEKYAFLDPNVIHLEPTPNLEVARQMGEFALGKSTYNGLLNQLRVSGLAREAHAKAVMGKNTLIATAHFKNIMDTPASHNAVFVASDNEEFAVRNVIVANHMVKWLGVSGVPVVDVLRNSGHVVFGYPVEGALKHGVDKDIVQAGNRALHPVFKKMLLQGMVFHMAPTETRAKPIILEDGGEALMIPRVELSIANMFNNRMELAAMLTMDIREASKQAELTDFIQVNDVSDIHHMMRGSAKKLREMSGENVVYGLPEGAQLIEV